VRSDASVTEKSVAYNFLCGADLGQRQLYTKRHGEAREKIREILEILVPSILLGAISKVEIVCTKIHNRGEICPAEMKVR